ncbi:hypothetical protein SGGMMB4_04592 [Sodalis glossinidius str. 'morsitans']|uniref:Uncharacterized protein n=1 Tax=Sodalis glossinidius (strain morsitans) TaxID=343509 RepID=A0A193QLU3_SODGM|nr:hypothetical protein SGGMMB4_04592 [Sodalis glossinidius str. 'morsitans']
MLLIYDKGFADKLTPFHYFRPAIDRANNCRPGHYTIAREILLKRRPDFCGGKTILAWLTPPEAGSRCVIFVPSGVDCGYRYPLPWPRKGVDA